MSFISMARKYLRYLNAVLVLCLLVAPVMAQQSWEVREGERRAITESENGSLCSLAKEASWENIVNYADRIELDMEVLLGNVCMMSVSTADTYIGNMWEGSARYSGFVSDVIKFSTRYLLKDRNNHELFVALVTGSNVPFSRSIDGTIFYRKEGGVFREFRDAWRGIPAQRVDLEIAARAICLSIDRYNVQGLDDIRQNECMTPPFVFPPRE
jgi:hypothetical protein